MYGSCVAVTVVLSCNILTVRSSPCHINIMVLRCNLECVGLECMLMRTMVQRDAGLTVNTKQLCLQCLQNSAVHLLIAAAICSPKQLID